jgi:hypothetical protein
MKMKYLCQLQVKKGLTKLKVVLYLIEYLDIGIYMKGGDGMASTRKGSWSQVAPNSASKKYVSANR